MTFNPNAPLDPGQITDRRGMGTGGLALGGGGAIGVVLLLAYVLLGGNPSDLGPVLEPGAVVGPGSSAIATDCKTGADANQRDDCRILGYVNSVQKYWTDEFTASGETYQPVDTVLFTGATSSGCGTASRPPARSTARPTSSSISTSTSSTSCGRSSGPGRLAGQGYVVAHEYGHHVQDLLGTLQNGGDGTGAEGRSGPDGAPGRLLRGRLGEPRREHRLPPAADRRPDRGCPRCGARRSATTGSSRPPAARSTPDSWTHGSSAQRQKWFWTGYKSGDPAACDVDRGHLTRARIHRPSRRGYRYRRDQRDRYLRRAMLRRDIRRRAAVAAGLAAFSRRSSVGPPATGRRPVATRTSSGASELAHPAAETPTAHRARPTPPSDPATLRAKIARMLMVGFRGVEIDRRPDRGRARRRARWRDPVRSRPDDRWPPEHRTRRASWPR